ncbi:hypothetical protein V6N13_121545 [Hibiscus sabdariffa]
MENPNSLANPAQGAMINGDVLVGNPGGRPPEDIVLDGNLNSLERPGSPILVVDQPGCKRGRMDDGLMEDLIDPEDGLGNLMTEGDRRTTMVMEDDGRTKHLMQGSKENVMSFKDTLLGKSNGPNSAQALSELDVEETCGLTEVTTDIGEPGVEARDPKALYGPWMQVTNRRRRNDTNQSATNLNKGTGEIKNPMGSRFAALFESLTVMEDGNEEEPLGGFEGGIEGAKISTPNGNSQKAGNLHNLEINIDSSQVQEGRKNSGKETKTKSKSNILDNSVEGKNTGYTYRHQSTKSVASKGKVEVAKSSLNPEKHTAVRMSGEEGIQEPRILKGGNKVTLKTKKKDGGGTLKTTLAQQLSPLLSDLENSVSGEGERFGDTHTGVVPEISQGARSPEFYRSYKLLVSKQKPDIFVVMEPRISGSEADAVIRRSGFEFSYRVEAQGFFGGIWLLWNNTIKVDVLAVSTQFIHASCLEGNGGRHFFGTFVYACRTP